MTWIGLFLDLSDYQANIFFYSNGAYILQVRSQVSWVMHNLSTMKQIKTWFAPLNLKSALHVVLQIYVFWGDVNLSGHLKLCILMVFRPSRVRRILMQFYVWKNINGLFTFALSTPEDRLHDIIVFLYIWSSKFQLLIYRWK